MFQTYLLCEVVYYLYSKHVTYKQLENIHYSENRALIPYKSSFDIYKYLLRYFTNESDLNVFFTEVFLDNQSITINSIKKLLSYHIFNIDPNTNKGIRLWQSIYINSIIKIIKPRVGILNNINTITNTNKKSESESSLFLTNKLDIIHKPLAFYTIMYFIRRAFNFYMYTLGFTNIIDPSTQLRVWIKYNSCADNKVPVVLFHGLGFGIMPYIGKIRQLSTSRTLILPEYPNISHDLYKFPPPSNDTIVSSLYNTLIKWGINLVDTIGHSYGALIMNIFQIRYPHMCNHKTYAEPMCFNIHLGKCANTIYKFPSSLKYNIITYILWSFVFRDMSVQYIGKRDIFVEHTMAENFDNKTHIILAKRDYTIPSLHIHKYITTHHPDVNVTLTDGNHGTWLST